MEPQPFLRPLCYSALAHVLVLFLLLWFLGSFLAPRTPLMMELTLIGEMSKGEGLGANASNPGQVPDQNPVAKTEGTFASPQQKAALPLPPVKPKPQAALPKSKPVKPNSGKASSEAYLESLDKSAPIGLAIHKDATNQIKTTAGLGHLGVAGSPEGNAQIEGELAARAVKTKVFPQYPAWAKQQGVEGSVKFQLTVLPNGLIKNDLELEQTSGYQELDRVVYEALIQWEFTALAPEVPQVNQSGVITFSFDLKQGN
ncbi:MAG TPA: energy transducer TonB [bacterium]|nr:energy transducer TonB [bacterium]